MTRPLVVSDCDEVLLHMVRHFRAWLDREQGVEFTMKGQNFARSMRRRGSDQPLSEAEMWDLLGAFFDTEMHTQTPIEGAVEAIAELQREADVVILTNLVDERNEARCKQLLSVGINAPVYTNQGPKGGALSRIIAERTPTRVVFVDDIARHHESARQEVPHGFRLHFCGEPELAEHVPCAFEAGDAHARIDTWREALPWILETLHGEAP